jgi:hypothetical protein
MIKMNMQPQTPSCCCQFEEKPKFKSKEAFTAEEDQQIIEFVHQNGLSRISELKVKNRTTRQLRDRYKNYLDPKISKNNFNQEEDMILLSSVEKYGQKWSFISSAFFVSRTAISLKYRYQRLINLLKKTKIEAFYFKKQDRIVFEKSRTISSFSHLSPLDRTQDPTTDSERKFNIFPLPEITHNHSEENIESFLSLDSIYDIEFSREFEDILFETSYF